MKFFTPDIKFWCHKCVRPIRIMKFLTFTWCGWNCREKDDYATDHWIYQSFFGGTLHHTCISCDLNSVLRCQNIMLPPSTLIFWGDFVWRNFCEHLISLRILNWIPLWEMANTHGNVLLWLSEGPLTVGLVFAFWKVERFAERLPLYPICLWTLPSTFTLSLATAQWTKR